MTTTHPTDAASVLREIIAMYDSHEIADSFGPHNDPTTSDAFDALIARAKLTERAAIQPAGDARCAVCNPVRCVVCHESEAHTGTCGSSDPRALCNLAPPVCTPVQAAPVDDDILTQARYALEVAMQICDAVPTRLHNSADSTMAHIGMLVNARPDGKQAYAIIRDALYAVRAATPGILFQASASAPEVNQASELPPLPKPYIDTMNYGDLYCEADMRAYGQACIAMERVSAAQWKALYEAAVQVAESGQRMAEMRERLAKASEPKQGSVGDDADSSVQRDGRYHWESRDGQQHDTGVVYWKNPANLYASSFAWTSSPGDARLIAEAMNATLAARSPVAAPQPDVRLLQDKLARSETLHFNYVYEVSRIARQEAAICNFPETDAVRALIGQLCEQAQPDVSARDRTLEEAARECEGMAQAQPSEDEHPGNGMSNGAKLDCANAIRALKSAAPESAEPSAEPPTWKPITAPGQVKVGDKLRFTIGDDKYNETVKQILDPGTEREELLYNKRKNYYVITKNAMTDFGSSKNVEFLSSDRSNETCAVCGSKWGDNCKAVECSYESIGERTRLATSSAAKGASDHG